MINLQSFNNFNYVNEARYIRKVKQYTPPDGWVNVKIDDLLFKRMEKYVYDIDDLVVKNDRDRYNLFLKINVLSNIRNIIADKEINIQKKISLICILQYLKELKKHFNASSSGFLLEGFLATLIHGKIVPGRKLADITTTYNELDAVEFDTQTKIKYQIKLYKKNKNGIINVNFKKALNYYVICLKDEATDKDKVDIHILDGRNTNKPNYIGRFSSSKDVNNFIKPKKNSKGEPIGSFIPISISKLNRNLNSKKTLEISNLDDLIEISKEGIKDMISNVYNNLSDLSYDIDSLVSGRGPNGDQIDVDTARLNSIMSASKIKKEINNLTKHIKK